MYHISAQKITCTVGTADQGNATYQQNATYENNSTCQENTGYQGTIANANMIAYETSTLQAALPEAITKDGEEKVKQFVKEFLAHVTAELSDGARRASIEKWIRHYVMSVVHDETAVSDALQAVAATFAMQIYGSFGEELQKEIAIALAVPWRAQLRSSQPRTETEYEEFLAGFVTQHLRLFYDPNDEDVRKVASKAAKRVKKETKISQKLIPGLAKLALYDFIFLCGM
jgi:D-arabinose 1-dehydrogenase-like Zn-dependent alcohol dehydrogenase